MLRGEFLDIKDRRRNKCFNPSLRGASWRRSNPGSTARTLPPRTRGFAARRAPLATTFEALIFPAVLRLDVCKTTFYRRQHKLPTDDDRQLQAQRAKW